MGEMYKHRDPLVPLPVLAVLLQLLKAGLAARVAQGSKQQLLSASPAVLTELLGRSTSGLACPLAELPAKPG